MSPWRTLARNGSPRVGDRRRTRRPTGTIVAVVTGAVLAVTLAPVGTAGAAAGDPGPLVTLPFSNRLYPDPTTGGPGTDALNDLVARACNHGAPLADRQWFTLPSKGAGLIVVLAQRLLDPGPGSPERTPVGVAVVDHGAGRVLGCGSDPVRVEDGTRRSAVVWSDASVIERCPRPREGCTLDPLEAFVNWTSGRPANDRWQDAEPIDDVPFGDTADLTVAATDGPGLTHNCRDDADNDAKDVWFRFTPAVSGALSLDASGETYGPLDGRGVGAPHVAIGKLTSQGPVPVPEDPLHPCTFPWLVEVEAGTTYLISLHTHTSGLDLVPGGHATLALGALRPTKPQNVRAIPGDQQVVVRWSPPEHAGSSPITGYLVHDLSTGSGFILSPDERSYTARRLNGNRYGFTVTAMNAAGPGNASAPVYATPAADPSLPTEPSSVVYRVQDALRTATLTWDRPTSSGDAEITGYRITRSGTDRAGAGPLSVLLPADADTYVFRNLKTYYSYTITLRAVTALGAGRPYQSEFILFPATPSEPQEVTAITGGRSAGVTWRAPMLEGYGGPVTGYRIRRFAAGSTSPEATTRVAATTTSLSVPGLTAGTEYTFDVTAINAAGTGEPSGRTAPVVPLNRAVPPSAPHAVTATQGLAASTATLTWEPPASTGGWPVTGYRVSRDGVDTTGAGPWSTTVPATTRSFTFTQLASWDTYALSVRAITGAGAGEAATRSVTIKDARPSAPTSVTATPGDGSVTVSWRAPLHQPGRITAYRIRQYGATGSTVQATFAVDGVGRSFTVTGLTNGTPYRFDVSAVNGSGTGRASDPTGPVTPSAGTEP